MRPDRAVIFMLSRGEVRVETQITVPMDVFLKIIEGQSRIEAKLDAHVGTEAGIEQRVCGLETKVNQADGARKTLVWLVPVLSCLAAAAGTAITYAISIGRLLEHLKGVQ